jgi:site-specific DNA-methyltransferase (adenine-specific)
LVVAGRGEREDLQGKDANPRPQELEAYAPATPEAAKWQGWGTALKPALEPITMARKPLTGTVAANVLEHGTGALNVDGCRVEAVEGRPLIISHGDGFGSGEHVTAYGNGLSGSRHGGTTTTGRWPANLIHDGSDEVVALFPVTTSGKLQAHHATGANPWVESSRPPFTGEWGGDTGSAARFFYCAKASKADRDEGCEGMELVTHQSGMGGAMPVDDDGNARDRFKAQSRNHHPTVKPTALMRYLCRLVTPPGGTILDPFMGSGSTGKGAKLEGFNFIGIEREAEYVAIAQARIDGAKMDARPTEQPTLFD